MIEGYFAAMFIVFVASTYVCIIMDFREYCRRTDNKQPQPKAKQNYVLGDVSEPLQTLKKIVAEKSIELIDYDKNDHYARNLRGEIELAIKSIEAIK
tara:strand:- start:655 stop:945 length:291 start_codon:yes stop_codon:yes gene_type:complete